MRTMFDLSPLYRSGVGFDRLFNLLENANRLEVIDNWPPYDIVKTGEDDYRITMAVAGFSEDELTITHEPNLLYVSGQKKAENEDSQYLHRGLAARAFQRRFDLADHVKVAGAHLNNGLLTIELKREVPEEMKPRRIAISTAALPKTETRQIEGEKKAA